MCAYTQNKQVVFLLILFKKNKNNTSTTVNQMLGTVLSTWLINSLILIQSHPLQTRGYGLKRAGHHLFPEESPKGPL